MLTRGLPRVLPLGARGASRCPARGQGDSRGTTAGAAEEAGTGLADWRASDRQSGQRC